MLKSATASLQPTVVRTLILWLCSNLGGTVLLGLTFSAERLEDFTIALLAGLVAAVVSLPLVPLAIPFFAVLGRFCPACSRRSVAFLGITLFFLLANQLLLLGLPFLSLGGLLSMSLPYWVAAALAVYWLYSPAGLTATAPLGKQAVRSQNAG